MDSGNARHLFEKYAAALAYVEVEDRNGDRHMGSAFHVGEGVFVTARHVVDGHTVTEIGSTEHTYINLTGREAEETRILLHIGDEVRPVHRVDNGVMEVAAGPFFHPDERVDVAVFKVNEIDSYTPVIRLGGHLDDWLGRSDFVLTEAIVLGYPPIPMSREPTLIGARAEVNALIDLYDAPYVHFVLSSMPRGGFSGGVAISEYDMALGLVTRSLTSNDDSVERGFMTVLSVEPVYVTLGEHKLLPDCQAEGWDEFWNASNLFFSNPNRETSTLEETAVASIELFDDGKRVAISLTCKDNAVLLQELIELTRNQLADYPLIGSGPLQGRLRLDIENPDNSTGQRALATARTVATELMNHGYVAMIPGPPGSEDLLPRH